MWGPDENVKDTAEREGELAAGELSVLRENDWLQPRTEQKEISSRDTEENTNSLENPE